MGAKRGAREIAPMIRGAFIRAVKALEAGGKPLSTIIMKELEAKPLETLKAISSFVPKEMLIEVGISEELSNLTEDALNASIERLIEQRETLPVIEGEGTQTQH